MKNTKKFLFIILYIFVGSAIYAESQKDTLQLDPPVSNKSQKKIPARPTWEYWVNAPLWVATSPLYLAYKGTAYTLGFIDEHHITDKVERIVISEDESRVIMPVYSAIYGGGVQYLKKGLWNKESKTQLMGSYGVFNRHSLQFYLKNLNLRGNGLQLNWHTQYNYLPTERFYDLGSVFNYADSVRSLYAQREIKTKIQLGMFPHKYVSLFVGGGVENYNIGPGKNSEIPSIETKDSAQTLFGIDQNATLWNVDSKVQLDTRTKRWSPTQGFYLESGLGYFKEIIDQRIEYAKFSSDFRSYLEMPWGHDRVVMFRGAFEKRSALNQSQIPFYLLSQIGALKTVRAFNRGRFRDEDWLVLSAEYRYPIWTPRYHRTLDAVLFIDAHQVSNDIFTNLKSENFKESFGIEFRYYSEKKLIVRIGLGFNRVPEAPGENFGSRFYLSLN